MNIEQLYYSADDPRYSDLLPAINYQNLNAVLDVLKDGAAYSKEQVAALAGSSVPFLTANLAGALLRELRDDGKVKELQVNGGCYYKVG